MTQRVARPMKFAAFISIIISVAVIFAACQGAVGPQGPKGDDGADGVDGTDGTAGAPAFQPLSAKAMSPFVVINNAEDADGETVAGAAQTIDLADYIYGTADRTYGTPTTENPTVVFDAKIEGSMLTITPKAPQPDSGVYVVETFTVEISDDGESTAIDLEIPARRNQSPEAPEADGTATVGNQAPDKAPDAVRLCTANEGAGANECYVDVEFDDDDGEITGSEEKLSFTATSSDTSKVEVVSYDNAPGEADLPNPLVVRLVVKGIASTWDADADAHDPVEVVVVATDAGGETVRGKAQISVDGAPTAETIPGGTISQATPTYTIMDVRGFFKNPESAAGVTFPVEDQKSSNTNVATVTVTDQGLVTVTRVARGTAEITITALEPTNEDPVGPAQTGSATFTVTVTD